MRESVIEKHLVKRVKELGGITHKTTFIDARGAPDRVVALPGRREFWLELKATGKAPEPHQVRMHNKMRRLGMLVEVADSIEAVEALLHV
jgi:hypothetical protein